MCAAVSNLSVQQLNHLVAQGIVNDYPPLYDQVSDGCWCLAVVLLIARGRLEA
jgi:hypothetical protein